jgi:radical SAM protein with 4Fe4S-binding SPASM domain
VGLAPRGVNSGNGFLFVSHRGEVFPSGFLPVAAGSVRERHLADIYRNAPLLRALREPDLLKGRCGYCEFRQICGGSRSRAFALTGDPFATDPWCAYQPARPDAPRAELAQAAS